MLPKKDWESRVTPIEEAHSLSKLSIDILIGKLLTHEFTMRQITEQQERKEVKKNSLAFKTLQDSSDEDVLEDSSENDNEIKSFIKSFY